MGPNGLNLSVTMFSAKAVCSQGLASLGLFLPLPLAGEHRPPPAAVLRKERRSEASAMAPLRGGWGLYPRAGPSAWREPPPPPPPASGRGRRKGSAPGDRSASGPTRDHRMGPLTSLAVSSNLVGSRPVRP